MVTQVMVQPSSWVETGIQIQKVRGLNLFKFNDELQDRLELLLDRHKNQMATEDEAAELAGITELDSQGRLRQRIFTLMNGRIISES